MNNSKSTKIKPWQLGLVIFFICVLVSMTLCLIFQTDAKQGRYLREISTEELTVAERESKVNNNCTYVRIKLDEGYSVQAIKYYDEDSTTLVEGQRLSVIKKYDQYVVQ